MKSLLAFAGAVVPVALAVLTWDPAPGPDSPFQLRRPWPSGWPSLDLVVPGAAEDVQTMGTGDIDFYIPAAPSAPAVPEVTPNSCTGPAPQSPPAAPADPNAGRTPPGYTLLSPDGKPLDNVLLGQPFVLELRVRTEDVKVNQTSPLFAEETIPVMLRTADGEEARITLQAVGGEPGVIVYRTPQPVSIGGRAGGMRFDGTVNDLGLNYPTGTEMHIVQLGAGPVLGGTSAFQVYSNSTQQGIAANRDQLDRVAQVLATERQVAEALLANPEVAGNPQLVQEVQQWLGRIASREYMVAQGRNYIQNQPLPIYQLRFSSFFVDRLVSLGPNGLEVAPDAPTAVDLTQGLSSLQRELDGQYKTGGIVPPAAMGVIAGYVIGGTTTFAHVTMAASFNQLITGQDLFGQEASRGWAVVELGIGIAAIKLPPKIIDFVAGRGINNLGFEISIGGRSGRLIVPGRSGELAAATQGGQTALPGAPRATPRPGQLPGTGQLPPGASVSNLPIRIQPGRRGLAAPEADFWYRKATDGAPASFKARLAQEANNIIAQMDEAIAAGRSRGIPENVLDDILTRARNMDISEAGNFVAREVSFEAARQNGGRILVSPDDMGQMSQWYTPDQMGQMSQCNLNPLEAVIAKAHLEAGGKPQRWTVDEIQILRDIDRRAAQGEDFSLLKKAELIEQTGPDGKIEFFVFDGFQPVFGSGDLNAIRTAVTKPLFFDTSAPVSPGPAGGILPAPPNPILNTNPNPVLNLNPAVQSNAFSGPSGQSSGPSQIEIVFRGTGGSTGEVMDALVINYGGPIRFQTSGLVLEPLDPRQLAGESNRLNEIFGALNTGGLLNQPNPARPPDQDAEAGGPRPGGNFPDAPGLDQLLPGARVLRVAIDAYCLEFLKTVPAAGTVFRIANQAKQLGGGRLRGILAASRRLQERLAILPDGNPTTYFHSLRQWAVWVNERKLGRSQFESEFLKHARKNFTAVGRAFTPEVERAVRELLPNRWKDITSVLEEAGRQADR